MSLLSQFEEAIIANDVKKVLELIQDNAEIMTSELSFGGISIQLAAREGSFEVLKCLLEKNLGLLHVLDTQNQSALLWAASRGHWEIVDYLAGLGADVNLPTILQNKPEVQFPPLYWAINKDHDKVVDVLIQRGASVNARWGEKKSQLKVFSDLVQQRYVYPKNQNRLKN